MEAVPRLRMLSFPSKESPKPTYFDNLKPYITNLYQEDPDKYVELLDASRAGLEMNKSENYIKKLKTYYFHLQSMQNHFPQLLEKKRSSPFKFTWKGLNDNKIHEYTNIQCEQAIILYNIATAHSQQGAAVIRADIDGMKLACTHYQCAAWAFGELRGKQYKNLNETNIDILSPELLLFMQQVAFAQAQECILEKSLIDNRKPNIVAKVTAQIVVYYNAALAALLAGGDDKGPIASIVERSVYKLWKKYIRFKIAYLNCILYLYQGQHAEEQNLVGERCTFYEAASNKLEEARKESKGLPDEKEIQETLIFTTDVVEGKRKNALKENEFIYHATVPELTTIPAVQGANLVNGIKFSITDSDLNYQDIFARLIPMKAHEASSLYSEEKAKLLRQYGEKIEEKDNELTSFMNSLSLENLNINEEKANKIPQGIVDRCASLNANEKAIPDLMSTMARLSEISTEVEVNLKETGEILIQEEKEEREFQQMSGVQRPPNAHVTELLREYQKYSEAHQKANESNETLRKAIELHINNLNILAKPLSDIQQSIPKLSSELNTAEIFKDVKLIVNKVNEMKAQRSQFHADLRIAVNDDDITSKVVANGTEEDLQYLFQHELEKHERTTQLIDQNLLAQENILKALTESYAKAAPVLKTLADVKHKRESFFASLAASFDIYEDLLAKSSKGLEFYVKLSGNVQKLLSRCKSAKDVQTEERQQRLIGVNSKLNITNIVPTDTSLHNFTTTPNISTPKLRDYLKAKGAIKDITVNNNYIPTVRPNPLGSENPSQATCSTSYHYSSNLPNSVQTMSVGPNEPPPPYSLQQTPFGITGYTNPMYSQFQRHAAPPAYKPQASPNSQLAAHIAATVPNLQPHQLHNTQLGITYNEAAATASVNAKHVEQSDVITLPNMGVSIATSTASDTMNSHVLPTYGITNNVPNTSNMPIQFYGQANIIPSTQVTSVQSQVQTQPFTHRNNAVNGVQSETNANAMNTFSNSTHSHQQQQQPQKYLNPSAFTVLQSQATLQSGANASQLENFSASSPTQQMLNSNGTPQNIHNLQLHNMPLQWYQQQGIYMQNQQTSVQNQQQITLQNKHKQQQQKFSQIYQSMPGTTNATNNSTETLAPANHSKILQKSFQSIMLPPVSLNSNTLSNSSPSYQLITQVPITSQLSPNTIPLQTTFQTAVQPNFNVVNESSSLSKTPIINSNSLIVRTGEISSHTSRASYPYNPIAEPYNNHQAMASSNELTTLNEMDANSPIISHAKKSIGIQPSSLAFVNSNVDNNINHYNHPYVTPSTAIKQMGASYQGSIVQNNFNNSTQKSSENTSQSQQPLTTSGTAPTVNNSTQSDPYNNMANIHAVHNSITSGSHLSFITTKTSTMKLKSESSCNLTPKSQLEAKSMPDSQPVKDSIIKRHIDLLTDTDYPIAGPPPVLPEPILKPQVITTSPSCSQVKTESIEQNTFSGYTDNKQKQVEEYLANQIESKTTVTNTVVTTSAASTQSSNDSPGGRKSSLDNLSICSDLSSLDNFDWDSISIRSDKLKKHSNNNNSNNNSTNAINTFLLIPQNPFIDEKTFKYFHKEVERYEKIIETLNVKMLNGNTPLTAKWKEIHDIINKESSTRTTIIARLFPEKNRSLDCLPYDHARVTLDKETDDYINAANIRDLGYGCPNIIIAQTPQQNTINDFWSMIWSQKARTILCLHPPNEILDPFWPQFLEQESHFDDYSVKCVKVIQLSHCQEYQLKFSTLNSDAILELTVLQIKAWSKSNNLQILNVAHNALEAHRQRCLDFNTPNSPLVLCCLTGSERSGLLVVALCSILATQNKRPVLINVIDVWQRICCQRQQGLRDMDTLERSLQIVLNHAHDVLNKRGIMTSYQMKMLPQQKAIQEEQNTKDPLNELDALWKLKMN